jgi:DNA-binding MarR family transcriptional regulator
MRAGITRQAVTKVLDELERLDVLRRDPDPDDGRGVIVRYTDRGRAGLDIVRKRMLELEAEFAERVGGTRWADARAVLETLFDDREQGPEQLTTRDQQAPMNASQDRAP